MGILLYCAALVLSAVDQALIHLAGGKASIAQLTLIRNCGGLLVVIVIVLANRQGLSVFRTNALGLQLFRSGIGVAYQLMFMLTFVALPLSLATAMLYLQSFFMVLFGALLGESFRLRHSLPLLLGLFGVLLIVKPTVAAWNWIYLIGLTAPALNAAAIAMMKRLESHDSLPTILLYVSIVGIVVSAPLCIGQNIPSIPWWLLPSLLLIGPIANYFVLMALRHADVAALAPYLFIRLPIAAAIGFALFHEIPDAYSFVGATVILLACSVRWPSFARSVDRASRKPPRASDRESAH
ncbi:MAG TPA: DMT family transporter [Xanthobacteraceae bacterium]